MYRYLLIWLISLFMSPVFSSHAQNKGVPASSNQVIRVLAIGNSFSEDAIENYLYDLAKASGKKIIIGNLYIGGAPIELHLRNILSDTSIYRYTKVKLNGEKEVLNNSKLSFALADEKWDYISFQQASPHSGLYDTYEATLPALYQAVQQVTPQAKYILHQTWAYQHNSDHDGFKLYHNNQLEMYHAIAETSKKVYAWGKFSLLVPAGTAVQNARTSSIGDHYTRDGYHLNLDYGRFTAACTWFEVLFGENVLSNPYRPKNVTAVQAEIAKEAAHKAVLSPYEISKVTN